MSKTASVIIGRNTDAENFHTLIESVRASFAKAVGNETVLFTTDAENLYDIILENVPAEQKRFYSCNTCIQFVNRFGGLVTISDGGEIHPVMWDDAPAYYAGAVGAIRQAVCSAKITGVFLTKQKRLGVPETDGWKHLSVDMPAHLLQPDRLTNIKWEAACITADYHILSKNFSRLDPEAVAIALEAMDSIASRADDESIFSGEDHSFHPLGITSHCGYCSLGWQLLRDICRDRYRRSAVEWLRDVLTAAHGDPKACAILWKKAATAPRKYCRYSDITIDVLLEAAESRL